MKTKLLIIGASGFIGNSLFRYFSHKPQYSLTGTCYSSKKRSDFDYLDVTSISELTQYLLKSPPDFIIYAAGNKNISDCENDYEKACLLNYYPINTLISIIYEYHLSTKLLYLSTDYVFEGTRGGYSDIDVPNPRTNYGFSKLAAERSLLNSGLNCKIIRSAAVMGRNGLFFDWLIKKLIEDPELSLYENVFFTPTSSHFLSEMIEKVVAHYDQISERILHIVGEKRISRYEFGLIMKELLHSDCYIIPDKCDENNGLFQPDLSLIPSNIIYKWRSKNQIEYLKEEIHNDPTY